MSTTTMNGTTQNNGHHHTTTTSTTTTETSSVKSNEESTMIVADINEWKKQLITKEDPYNIHKTLGISCLCSFLWRYCHIGSSDMGFLSHPQYTIPTLCLHFLLTASAFDFKIPLRRIKDGSRIWPEYRMHAMVFLLRSIFIIGRYWYEDQYHVPRWYDYNIVIVIGAMIAADLCSASVGQEYQSHSIRDLDTHPAVKYFFSVMQFLATTGYLLGLKRYTFPFLAIMVVQLTPFLGTLRRKNLISRNLGAFLYGVFLLSSYFITQSSPGGSPVVVRLTTIFGLSAATWRLLPLPSSMKVLQSKYLIWGTISYLIRYLRPNFTIWDANDLNIPFLCAIGTNILLAYYKIYYGYNNSISKRKKTV